MFFYDYILPLNVNQMKSIYQDSVWRYSLYIIRENLTKKSKDSYLTNYKKGLVGGRNQEWKKQ